jgi:hypothetical protein
LVLRSLLGLVVTSPAIVIVVYQLLLLSLDDWSHEAFHLLPFPLHLMMMMRMNLRMTKRAAKVNLLRTDPLMA